MGELSARERVECLEAAGRGHQRGLHAVARVQHVHLHLRRGDRVGRARACSPARPPDAGYAAGLGTHAPRRLTSHFSLLISHVSFLRSRFFTSCCGCCYFTNALSLTDCQVYTVAVDVGLSVLPARAWHLRRARARGVDEPDRGVARVARGRRANGIGVDAESVHEREASAAYG